MELICVPYFEVIGLNADFGKSSIEILQNEMEKRTDERQLVMPLENYIAVTDNINQQISWANSNGCLYLQQTTLMQIEKNIQVNIRIMNLNTGNYVFKNIYKANSKDDLPLIFEQLGNTLQHPEFKEAKANIADIKDSTKRRTMNHLGSSLGIFNYSNQYLFDARFIYLWDIRTLWIEAIFSFKSSIDYEFLESGIRILYPFSSKRNTFYIGSGSGFSMRDIRYGYDYSYGMFVENSLGYLVWLKNKLPIRIEAAVGAMFHDEKTMGGGLRIITGLPTAREMLGTPNSKEKKAK
jgi:hypothetical protein